MWRKIKGYRYRISDIGKVLSMVSLKILKPRNRFRYFQVALWRKGRQKNFYIHQLVADYFIGPRPEGQEIHHLDGDRSNNRVNNLRYVTRTQHQILTQRLGQTQVGIKHWNCRLSRSQVVEILASLKKGITQQSLAIKFKVSQPHIARIKAGVVRKDVH
jgi:hypothetical protein